jgi:alkylated DNA repair dioxygenase AlkB
MPSQINLFDGDADAGPQSIEGMPEGFRYVPSLVGPAEENALVEDIRGLPFRDFEFHGYTGKRRVVSFGWQYDFAAEQVRQADDIPGFLLAIRPRAAALAGLDADSLHQVLVTEYGPGAGIGWHRDKAVFGDVIGISLLSPCRFRLRRKLGSRWERASLTLEPRSAYLLRGPSRTEWEHSIPAVDAPRYSITFRTLSAAP